MSIFADWGKARNAASVDYLKTGRLDTALGGSSCTFSGVCAVGYACISGRCEKIDNSGGGSGGYYPPTYPGGGGGGAPLIPGGDCGSGPDDDNSPPGLGGCATPSGPNTPQRGCTVPTCGDPRPAPCIGYGCNDSDCCGVRTCRYQANPSDPLTPIVNCWCGAPDNNFQDQGPNGEKLCNKFCQAYYDTNGEQSSGCAKDTTCDECSVCTDFETLSKVKGYCKKKSCGDSPCHCCPDNLSGCQYCKNDGTTGNEGGDCGFCCTRSKTCGDRTYVFKSCGYSSLENLCKYAQQEADDACGSSYDPSKFPAGNCFTSTDCSPSCVGKTQCGTGTCPDEPPPNENNKANRITGCIETPGEYCITYEECDYSTLAQSCQDTSCSCDQDCPAGKTCNSCGECE